MKSIHIILVLSIFLLTAIQVIPQSNTNPEVTNVAFSISGTTVTVTYDVTDTEQDAFTIIMLVSSDGGSTWDFDYGTSDGDIGTGVEEGINRQITWEYTGPYNPNFKIRIYANDETADGDNCGKVYYEGGPNSDGGGAYYNTIVIGTQCWLKENLNVGIRINGSQNQTNNSPTNFIEKYCYNDLDANCVTYSGLYQWNEAMQYITTEGTEGICPAGWHIPTYAELHILTYASSNNYNYNGDALLAISQTSNGCTGTNTSGFSALLAGFRWGDLLFHNLNKTAYIWSSTVYSTIESSCITIHEYESSCNFAYRPQYYKHDGFSIRCLKN